MLDDGTVGRVSNLIAEGTVEDDSPMSLSEYLQTAEIDENLFRILFSAAAASAQVAKELRTLTLSSLNEEGGNINIQGEKQKGMDVRANEIFVQQLKPLVLSLVSEEEEDILAGDGKMYAIAFDPLDGSSNLDVAAPTGTIFGVYRQDTVADNPFGRPARHSLVAAGYTVYSSATELVMSIGDSAVGFTLDESTFRCSRTNMICPDRGPYYSLREAREPDWPDGLRKWIHDAKRGETSSGMKYSARYVCSLTSDVHRTLLKGGWAGRPHLRLLYEAAPLAFIMEKSGGVGSDGVSNLLDIKPTNLHERVCCFLGSKSDIRDLLEYGDVQQETSTQA